MEEAEAMEYVNGEMHYLLGIIYYRHYKDIGLSKIDMKKVIQYFKKGA